MESRTPCTANGSSRATQPSKSGTGWGWISASSPGVICNDGVTLDRAKVPAASKIYGIAGRAAVADRVSAFAKVTRQPHDATRPAQRSGRGHRASPCSRSLPIRTRGRAWCRPRRSSQRASPLQHKSRSMRRTRCVALQTTSTQDTITCRGATLLTEARTRTTADTRSEIQRLGAMMWSSVRCVIDTHWSCSDAAPDRGRCRGTRGSIDNTRPLRSLAVIVAVGARDRGAFASETQGDAAALGGAPDRTRSGPRTTPSAGSAELIARPSVFRVRCPLSTPVVTALNSHRGFHALD